jgi:CheY-like chemotaxis protein
MYYVNFSIFLICHSQLKLRTIAADFRTNCPRTKGMPMPVILVVDDNPQMVKLMQEMVQLAGYKTEVAFSGLEGLDKAKAGMPDLILVDLMMPEMDGWELYHRLREFTTIPIIFVTAYDTPQNEAKAIAIGAEGFIGKDLTPMQLVQQIQFVLEAGNLPSKNDILH